MANETINVTEVAAALDDTVTKIVVAALSLALVATLTLNTYSARLLERGVAQATGQTTVRTQGTVTSPLAAQSTVKLSLGNDALSSVQAQSCADFPLIRAYARAQARTDSTAVPTARVWINPHSGVTTVDRARVRADELPTAMGQISGSVTSVRTFTRLQDTLQADVTVVADQARHDLITSSAHCTNVVTLSVSAGLIAKSVGVWDDFVQVGHGDGVVVMCAQSGAVSRYTDTISSVASDGDRLYGVVGNVIHQLNASQAGDIPAKVVWGYMDFGTENTKRLMNIWVGVEHSHRLSATVHAQGTQTTPYTYAFQPHNTHEPRNCRALLGRGLNGRYWKFTLANTTGEFFKIYSVSADVAASGRRSL